MNLRSEIKEYTDKHGLVSGDGETSGNGLRYTSEYILTLFYRGEITEQDVFDFSETIAACESTRLIVKKNQRVISERIPGLFNRSPDHGLIIAQDDYVPLVHVGAAAYPALAHDIFNYGLNNGNNFNNVDPGIWSSKSWLGRYPAWVAHTFFGVRLVPSFVHQVMWAMAVLWACGAEPRDQDAWMLTWHLVRTYELSGLNLSVCTVAASMWNKKVKSVHKDGLGLLLGDYFNDQNHPVAKYFVTEP